MKRLLAVSMLLLPSCATIMSGGPDIVTLTSEPSGAKVTRKSVHIGTTPCQIVLRRGEASPQLWDMELAGYHKQPVKLTREGNPWVLGNLIFGGLLGIFVDAVTSNTSRYPTAPIHVPLIPEGDLAQGTYLPHRGFEQQVRAAEAKVDAGGSTFFAAPEGEPQARWTTAAR